MKLIIWFFIKNWELLEAYNNTWEKVSNLIKKDLVVNQCIKIIFYANETPKLDVVFVNNIIDSAFKVNKQHYPQILLEKCKCCKIKWVILLMKI